MFPFRPIFCKFVIVRSMGMVKPLFHNSFSIYLSPLLKRSGLTLEIFDISTFSIVLCLFSLHLMEIFRKTHNS